MAKLLGLPLLVFMLTALSYGNAISPSPSVSSSCLHTKSKFCFWSCAVCFLSYSHSVRSSLCVRLAARWVPSRSCGASGWKSPHPQCWASECVHNEHERTVCEEVCVCVYLCACWAWLPGCVFRCWLLWTRYLWVFLFCVFVWVCASVCGHVCVCRWTVWILDPLSTCGPGMWLCVAYCEEACGMKCVC